MIYAHFFPWRCVAEEIRSIHCLFTVKCKCDLRGIFYIALTSLNFLCVEEKRMHVDGMVFDTSSRTLFWVDPIEDIIAKMHIPQKGKPGDPVVLHTLTGNSPRGIALDVCNRCAIYNILCVTGITSLIRQLIRRIEKCQTVISKKKIRKNCNCKIYVKMRQKICNQSLNS